MNCLTCEYNDFRRCGVPFCVLPRCIYRRSSKTQPGKAEEASGRERPAPGKPMESG